tara:strand:+ start:1014 stop:1910 length:897 start_codon:yes stop_codon:yes gene_type:complete
MKNYLQELRLADSKTLEKDVELRVLSLGAGVQSSTVLFKMLDQEIKPADIAIFADTGNEPKEVYVWLDYLKDLMKDKMDFYVVRNEENTGHIIDDYKSASGRHSLIPLHIKRADGTTSINMRTCTAEYKIKPLQRKVKEILGGSLRGRCVEMVMGISYDEIQRAKTPSNKWQINCYPLVENKITRSDCKHWISHTDYGQPPRSACIICPYHDNKEWKNLKDNYPDEFEYAVKFDEWLRNPNSNSAALQKFRDYNEKKQTPSQQYVYKGKVPLREATFDEPSDYQGTLFDDECEGMCGI